MASQAKLSKESRSEETSGASTASVTAPSSVLRSIAHRTLQGTTSIKPDGEHRHYKSTPTNNVDDQFLGFFGMGHNTVPTKKIHFFRQGDAPSSTPTKKENTQQKPSVYVSPNYSFTFERHSLELSVEAQKVMEETRSEAAKIRAQMATQAPIHNQDSDPTARKIARPKGKVGRFSDVHMAAFKKMDSISNHASAWRSDPNRIQSANTRSLKRSPSKADLDSPSKSPVLNLLKRTPSKAGLNSASEQTPQKLALTRTPIIHQAPTSSYKRVKHSTADDVTTLPPKPRDVDSQSNIPTIAKGGHAVRSKLLTPTKSSIARFHSTKNLKATQILSVVRSKSSKDLRRAHAFIKETASVPGPSTPSPVRMKSLLETPIKMVPVTPIHKSGIKPPMKIKSILRTPHHLYSNDPSKIVAGTHLSTPPDVTKVRLQAPATAPVVKHVNFSASTQLKATRDEMKAASVEPEQLYPILPLAGLDSPDRRVTLSDLSIPGTFTFRSGTPMKFRTVSVVSTIRPVRTSDAGSAPNAVRTLFSRKRKADAILDFVEEVGEDKENGNGGEVDERPSKKLCVAPQSTPIVSSLKKPGTKSRLPALKGVVRKGLSTSRLNFLSMPKRRT